MNKKYMILTLVQRKKVLKLMLKKVNGNKINKKLFNYINLFFYKNHI